MYIHYICTNVYTCTHTHSYTHTHTHNTCTHTQLERKLGLLTLYYIQSVIIIPTMMLLPNVHYLYNM